MARVDLSDCPRITFTKSRLRAFAHSPKPSIMRAVHWKSNSEISSYSLVRDNPSKRTAVNQKVTHQVIVRDIMAPDVRVRRTRLNDADEITAFINKAKPGNKRVNRAMIIDRFSEVGFLLAEHDERTVGLLGWQIENLVVRVTDFLIAPAIDRVLAGRALIETMEQQAALLQAEAAILFLPRHPSEGLISFWELFDYERRTIADLNAHWREVAEEWNPRSTEVMIKQLREGLTSKPL